MRELDWFFFFNMVEGSSFYEEDSFMLVTRHFFLTGRERRNSEIIYAWPCWLCPVGTAQGQSSSPWGFLCVPEHAGEGTSESFVSRHIKGSRQFCTCLSIAKPSKGNQHGGLPLTHWVERGGQVIRFTGPGLLHTGSTPSCEGKIMLSLAKDDQVMRWCWFLSLSPGARANPRWLWKC